MRLRPLAILGVSAVLCSAVAAVADDQTGGVCFTAADNRNLAFDVVEAAPPPTGDERSYPYYPLTAAATMDIAKLRERRGTPFATYWFLWANRCPAAVRSNGNCGWNPKGNPLFPPLQSAGAEVRSFFSSVDRADACTLAQASAAMGDDSRTIDGDLQRNELRGAHRSDDLASLATEGKLHDVCMLPDAPLIDTVKGIVLDYEAQDGRSPAQTRTFLLRFAALVARHKRQVILYSTPLDAPTQRYTGLDADNIPDVAHAFDRIAVMLWSGNRQGDIERSLNSQLQLLGPEVRPQKMIALFELRGTTLADAGKLHGWLAAGKFGGVMFWRNLSKQGGSCDSDVNRKIACVVFGHCTLAATPGN